MSGLGGRAAGLAVSGSTFGSELRDVLIQRWGWLFAPSAKDLGFAVRTSVAAILSLLIAMWMELDSPQWAPLTVWVVATASRGRACPRRAGGLRARSSGLHGRGPDRSVPQQAGLFFIALALWIGLCCGWATFLDGYRRYGFLVISFTSAIVATGAISQPDDVFNVAMARGTYIMLGTVCEAGLAVLFLPNVQKEARARLLGKLQQVTAKVASHADVLRAGRFDPETEGACWPNWWMPIPASSSTFLKWDPAPGAARIMRGRFWRVCSPFWPGRRAGRPALMWIGTLRPRETISRRSSLRRAMTVSRSARAPAPYPRGGPERVAGCDRHHGGLAFMGSDGLAFRTGLRVFRGAGLRAAGDPGDPGTGVVRLLSRGGVVRGCCGDLCVFVVPVVTTPEYLALLLLIPMVIGGLAARAPKLVNHAFSFNMFLPVLIGPSNLMRYDEVSFLNGASAFWGRHLHARHIRRGVSVPG